MLQMPSFPGVKTSPVNSKIQKRCLRLCRPPYCAVGMAARGLMVSLQTFALTSSRIHFLHFLTFASTFFISIRDQPHRQTACENCSRIGVTGNERLAQAFVRCFRAFPAPPLFQLAPASYHRFEPMGHNPTVRRAAKAAPPAFSSTCACYSNKKRAIGVRFTDIESLASRLSNRKSARLRRL